MVPVLLLLALAPIDAEHDAPRPERPYTESVSELEARRHDFGARWRQPGTGRRTLREEARATVLEAITRQLMPAWYGTPWEFYGDSQTPGTGSIACGYFVSTVLRDAGFRVERIQMAQQRAEYIVKALAPPKKTWRFSDRPVSEVVDRVRLAGEGLYVVGLDYHVGFLWNDSARVWMCHASYLGEGKVLCEDALSSPAMVSGYHVVGKLLEDGMMDAWLEARELPCPPGLRRRPAPLPQ
ncbi:hypothetical protein [Comamonas sp. JC664]|uniref:hypothetical protein n=1 Tax=Comamonas sp. JC664 TaxID=2801917 RepID=UPI00191F255E|nr:hypothetical protein [Comamonas sp. JC664]MBL0695059.1 hypothetical protein [Comamonas sp. JC664]GHH04490.1 hypothetical protein GCM10012319_73950 [Comamonas sp. KCTC 72670]